MGGPVWLYGFQQCFQLGQGFDFVICGNFRIGGQVVGVYPAGANAGVDTALNIRCQAITDDHSLFHIKTGNLLGAAVKIQLVWFICTDLLGDKNLLEIMADIGACQSA